MYGRRGGTKPGGNVPSGLSKGTISCTRGYPNVMRPSLYKFIRYGLTNKLFKNSYVMLLIMRELFCLNALWKVKSSHENKKFLMKRKLFIKDKRFFEVLLCYKDKVSNESTSLCLKVIRYLFLWNVKFYNHESYSILWEEVYKEKFSY